MQSMISKGRRGIASSLSAVLTALGLGAAGMVQAQSLTINGVAFDLYQGLPVPANLQGPLTITTGGSLPIVIPEGLWTVQNGQVFIAQSLAPQIAAAGGATGIISVPATGALASAAGLVATAGGATEDEEAGDDEDDEDDESVPTQTTSLPVITDGTWADFPLTNSADGVAAGLGKGQKIHVLGVEGTDASIRTIPFDVFIENSGDGVETVAGSVPDPFPFAGAFTEENDLIAVYDGTDAYTFNPNYGKSSAPTGAVRVLAHPTDATNGVNAFFNAAQGDGLILAAFNFEGLEPGSHADLEVFAYDPLTNTYDVLGFSGRLYDIVLADEDPTTASALTAFDGLDIAAISGFASADITSIQIADFDNDGDADFEMLITTNTNYIVVDLDG